jgi:quercetin dioxygenase-like cupin family protein
VVSAVLTDSHDSSYTDIVDIEGAPVIGRLRARVLLRGANALLVEFHIERGATIAAHRHSHECYLYVLKGRLRSTVGGQAFDLRSGDGIVHPIGIEHMSEALEESTWIEVKTPPEDRWYRSS